MTNLSSLPFVSIVTPSFNQVEYLEQTMQSVFSQDYPGLEYLVVDGASTDGSVELIQRYAGRLAWWVSEPDHGQAEAVNKGFRRARGEIIGWLNSDDLYLPGAVRSAVEVFTAHPECVLVFGDCAAINKKGETTNWLRYGSWGLEELMCFNIIGEPAVFVRRWALERAGYLDTHYHYLLDHHLWLRVAQLGELRYTPQPWAAARFHPSAKNVAQAAGFAQEAYEIVDWMQSQPVLQERFKRLQHRVWAGAYRLGGRYLLDGGQPGAALQAYGKSLLAHPPTALREWHRMLFALFSLAGLGRLGQVYRKWRQKRIRD